MRRILPWTLLALSLGLNGTLLWARFATAPVTVGTPDVGSECLIDRLEVPEASRTAWEARRARMMDDRRAYQVRLAALRGELADAIAEATPDRARIDAILGRFSTTQSAFQAQVAGFLVDVQALLPPGQHDAFRGLLRDNLFRHMNAPPGPPGVAPEQTPR